MHLLVSILILTCIIEVCTIGGRVKFGSVKKLYRRLKVRVHIHHGYIGIALISFVALVASQDAIAIVGWALLLSDALHHFVVLPLWVKATEFP